MNSKESISSNNYYFYAYLLFYWVICTVFPVINIGYADDSIRWANNIRYADGLINSHHLIFDVLRFFYSSFLLPLVTIDPYKFIAIYTATWGALGLLAIRKILTILDVKCKTDIAFAVILCSVFYGYFAYSMVADVYVPTIVCILFAVYFTLKSVLHPDDSSIINSLFASVFFFFAILHHQAFFIFIAGIFIWGIYSLIRNKNKAASLPLIKIPVLAGLLSVITYFLFYLTYREGNESFLLFVSGYAEKFTAYPDMKALTIASLIKAATGLGRALLNLNQLFYFDSFAHLIQSKFPYRHVFASVFSIKSIPAALVLFSLVTTVTALFTMALKLPSSAKALVANKHLLLVLIFCVLPQMIFFVWWEAISDEFWIWFVPFVAIFFALSTNNNRYQFYLRTILCISIAITTLIAFYIPAASHNANIDELNYSFVYDLKEGDVLVSFDEIVMSNKLSMLSKEQGFIYINLFTKAEKGIDLSNEYKLILKALTEHDWAKSKFIIGPYLTVPPVSYRNLVQSHSSQFFTEWEIFQADLKSHYVGIEIMHPLKTMKGYFTN